MQKQIWGVLIYKEQKLATDKKVRAILLFKILNFKIVPFHFYF